MIFLVLNVFLGSMLFIAVAFQIQTDCMHFRVLVYIHPSPIFNPIYRLEFVLIFF